MKLKLISLSLLLLCIHTLKASYGTWNIKHNFVNERSTHVAFSIDGIGYVCAGADKNGANLKDLWAYDNKKDTWIRKADFPGGERQELSCFVIDGYAYVGSGRDVQQGVCYSSYYQYNPKTNKWSRIADCPVARYAGVGFSIDSVGYFACGLYPGGPRMDDLYAYHPGTNKWIRKANVNSGGGRVFPIAMSYNGKGYLYGGYTGASILNGLWEYDPINDKWTYKSAAPNGERSYAFGFVIGSKMFIGMGRTYGTEDKKDWYYFDLINSTWNTVSEHPSNNTVGGACFVIGNQGYTIGGFDVPGTIYSNVNELTLRVGDDVNISVSSLDKKAINGYCNQSNKTLYLEIMEGDYELSILNLSGQEIYTFKGNSMDGGMIGFDLNELPSQQYFALVKIGTEMYTYKFALQ